MNQDQFLREIYGQIEVGMKVLTPKRVTDITEIRESGDIVYKIAGSYQKVLSRDELTRVFDCLDKDQLKGPTLRQIVPQSRTTNVSTIKWILNRFDLARELPDRSWAKNW